MAWKLSFAMPSRTGGHSRSAGLSSGLYAGKNASRTVAGTTSRPDVCQPAPSSTRIASSPSRRSSENSSRNTFITSTLTVSAAARAGLGRINQDTRPVRECTAAYKYVQAYRTRDGVSGRSPTGAQTLRTTGLSPSLNSGLSPSLASSWNHNSTRLPG